jgi:hypothetical protein
MPLRENFLHAKEVSGQEFSACGKTPNQWQQVSGQDFSACGKAPNQWQQVSGHDFRGCGKTHFDFCEK